MYSILQFLITLMFILSIPSFLTVFVLVAVTKLSNPMDNSLSEFWRFKIGRIALITLIVSVLVLISSVFLLNKMSMEHIKAELMNPINKIYINSEIVTNDSLLSDLKSFTKESDLRNTGGSEIKLHIKTSSEIIKLKLLRSYSIPNKYWVSSPDYGNGCFGEINTKYLSEYK